LPQRTHIFAKICPAKKGVDEEGRGEVCDQKPGGAPGMVPDRKASYDQKNRISSAIAIHLVRSQRGHFEAGQAEADGPVSRGSMKGHERGRRYFPAPARR